MVGLSDSRCYVHTVSCRYYPPAGNDASSAEMLPSGAFAQKTDLPRIGMTSDLRSTDDAIENVWRHNRNAAVERLPKRKHTDTQMSFVQPTDGNHYVSYIDSFNNNIAQLQLFDDIDSRTQIHTTHIHTQIYQLFYVQKSDISRVCSLPTCSWPLCNAVTHFNNTRPAIPRFHQPRLFRRPVWYENLFGVVSCPENSNINTDGLDSVVIGSRDQ